MRARLISISLIALLAADCITKQQNQTAVGTNVGVVVGIGIDTLIGNGKGTAIGDALGATTSIAVGYSWDTIKPKLADDTAGTGTQISKRPDDLLKLSIPNQVSFDTDNAVTKSSLRSPLDNMAQTLTQHPELAASVVSHTDGTNNPDYNLTLSQKRVQSVADYPMSRGVVRNRLSTKGRDQSQLAADNATKADRIQNRYIETYLEPTQG